MNNWISWLHFVELVGTIQMYRTYRDMSSSWCGHQPASVCELCKPIKYVAVTSVPVQHRTQVGPVSAFKIIIFSINLFRKVFHRLSLSDEFQKIINQLTTFDIFIFVFGNNTNYQRFMFVRATLPHLLNDYIFELIWFQQTTTWSCRCIDRSLGPEKYIINYSEVQNTTRISLHQPN